MEPDLWRQGLSALYLFGSVARDEAEDGSDIDVAFTVPDDVPFSLFDQASILNDVSDELGIKVDFVELRAFRARVQGEMVQVF